MNIEPCPYCGEECIPTGGGYLKCLNIRCPYHVPAEQLEQHNRLSRIVRAAEEYVMAREAIPEGVFAEFGDDSVSFPAYEELKDAVEGGREDG